MSDLRNNIFNYATKELSQDAFICWLSSFALEGSNDSDGELVRCSHLLINEFMKRGIDEDIDCSKITLKEVKKQFDQIDILLTVDYKGETYKIIVEDKVNSSEHDDQLVRYKEKLENDGNHIIGIYL